MELKYGSNTRFPREGHGVHSVSRSAASYMPFQCSSQDHPQWMAAFHDVNFDSAKV